MSSLQDDENTIIYDNIIIVTDRVVVDRQLQKAVMGMEHASGLIKVMDDRCSSSDLADALNGNTKIIATTIQKFPYIVEEVKNLNNKRFAVIIDEAHSSTSGKNMSAVTKSLASGEWEYDDTDEMIEDEIRKHGKQVNVSMFAFTATPKPTTLQMFGRLNKNGQYEAFHIYSMKQAIEEGFILDVLSNFTRYETFYQINKLVENDPRCKTNSAKRQIARFVQLHETNIGQRIEVIVEHFKNMVMDELGGQAKAMVITSSRPEAVKYQKAFQWIDQAKNLTHYNRFSIESTYSQIFFDVSIQENSKENAKNALDGLEKCCRKDKRKYIHYAAYAQRVYKFYDKYGVHRVGFHLETALKYLAEGMKSNALSDKNRYKLKVLKEKFDRLYSELSI